MKTQEELMEIALNGLLSERAIDDLGIYPKSIVGGPNAYEERNDYQNGWNEAIMKYTHKMVVYENFLGGLSDEVKSALVTLLFDDSIMLHERDDKVSVWINVNDTFYYAADMEDIAIEDLPTLAYMYEHYDDDGIVAWVAKKRDMEPLETKFEKTDNYLAAMDYLNGKQV